MMAECRHVVCTAGFESVSEAAWLGKPLFLVPVENHVEQQVNALDAQQFGFGLAENSFNLDRLAELPARLPAEKFRAWLDCAPEKFFQAVELAVKNPRDERRKILEISARFSLGHRHVADAGGRPHRKRVDALHRAGRRQLPHRLRPLSPLSRRHRAGCRKLGVNAYRFGIEWSRLQSAPFAPLNQNELARYVDLLDRLKAAGITPMVVLHHFSNPPWINAAGGWTNAATIPAFVDYVRKLVAALKDRVYLWNTFNEPDTYACVAYLLGGFPPQRKWQLGQFRRVIDAHGARACAGQPHHPARRRFCRPQTGSRHREELDVFPRVPEIFAVGPRDGVRLPLHVQQICAGRVSRRRAAAGLDVHRPELLWPRALPPFPRDDSRQRRAGEDS